MSSHELPPARPWRARPTDTALARQLSARLGIAPLAAGLLARRGVRDEVGAQAFLHPSVDQLLDPFGLAGMEAAADRLAAALARGETIMIYGDYDVDGLTATALLVQFLRFLGVEPPVYVPDRALEGYSFTTGGIAAIKAAGASVVVSVDNGISSVAAVAELQAAGIDVIITDHHLPGASLPPALAVINPRRADCGYAFKGLSGVGVAFKLACAVASRLGEARRRSSAMSTFLGEAMAWVALGTIADMVPLVGENRVLVARGLRAIPRSNSPGLAALCGVAGVRAEDFDEQDVGFKLAPRLNAAGRLGRSDLSLALLVARDEAAARSLAGQLDALNLERQRADREMSAAILEQLDALPDDAPVVLHDERWIPGLLGLVANRIMQRTGRPAVLISGKGSDPAKGSVRSVPGFDAHAALEACDGHLLGHGGHAAAAGFSIAHAAVPAFREAFTALWRAHRDAGIRPPVEYDGELPLAAVNRRLVEQLQALAPFGQGNERAVVGTRDVTVARARTMGADGSHLELHLAQGPAVLRAVAFGRGALLSALPPGRRLDVLHAPRLNSFRGRADVELSLVELRAHDPQPAASASGAVS